MDPSSSRRRRALEYRATADDKRLHAIFDPAARAGELLLVAREKLLSAAQERVPEEEWDQWVADNIKFPSSKAAAYMAIATRIRNREDPDKMFEEFKEDYDRAMLFEAMFTILLGATREPK